MEEWIKGKVMCLVTDATKMIAWAGQHSICLAHSLNFIVSKSLYQFPVLANINQGSSQHSYMLYVT